MIHFAVAFGLFTLFWTTVAFIPNPVVLLITNALVLSGSTAVGVAYFPVALRAIREAETARVQRIALGIAYSWTFGALWRIWTLLWITSGQQPWMVNNDLVAFFQAGIFLGAMYHLVSPGAIGGARGDDMPSLKWIATGAVCGVAILIASGLALYNPDTTAFVGWIKPWVPR